MADLATGTISSELKDAQGYYFEDHDVDTASVGTSSAFLDGKRQGRVEIVGVAKTEVVLAIDKKITIELQSDVCGGASYTTFDTPMDTPATHVAATTYVIGTELFRVNIPSDAKESIKAVITSQATNTGTIDIYDVYRS